MGGVTADTGVRATEPEAGTAAAAPLVTTSLAEGWYRIEEFVSFAAMGERAGARRCWGLCRKVTGHA